MRNRFSAVATVTLLMLACTHENDRPMTPANGTISQPNPSGTDYPSTAPDHTGSVPSPTDPSAPSSDIDNSHPGDANGAKPDPVPGTSIGERHP